MSSFRPAPLEQRTVPLATGWLLGACMEAKGKQDLWTRRKPGVLEALRERAMVQSAESSNRMEGVTVEAHRLRPIVLGRARPRDRSEEEVAGYRKALQWIFTRKRPVPIRPDVMLHLHKLAQGGFSGDAGRWKRRDNEIIEMLPDGERRVRFTPTSAKATPRAIAWLCDDFEAVCEAGRAPVLLAVSTCVFDFLCIHPFRDGNGRVSRLLTTLLLQQQGIVVGRYISLERLVEDTKEDYYAVLARCSQGWHKGKHDMVPWWNYLLSIIKQAYDEFAQQVEATGRSMGKGNLVRHLVDQQVGPFTLGELHAQCPSVSIQLVKKTLSALKEEGRVRVQGRGRGAWWENVR